MYGRRLNRWNSHFIHECNFLKPQEFREHMIESIFMICCKTRVKPAWELRRMLIPDCHSHVTAWQPEVNWTYFGPLSHTGCLDLLCRKSNSVDIFQIKENVFGFYQILYEITFWELVYKIQYIFHKQPNYGQFS